MFWDHRFSLMQVPREIRIGMLEKKNRANLSMSKGFVCLENKRTLTHRVSHYFGCQQGLGLYE